MLHKEDVIELKEESKEEQIMTFRPNISLLSRFGSPRWYLLWYCSILMFKSMVMNGFINTSIANLERRYKLSSKESSVISSMYDVGCMLLVLPVSYLGSRSHKPILVGFGSVIIGMGCFIFATPNFLSGSYEFNNTSSGQIPLCGNVSINYENCNPVKGNKNLKKFKYLFYLGQLFIGAGSAPLFTLGLAYVEEINDARTSDIHVALATASTALGSAIGYALGGTFLSIYVDIYTISEYMKPTETDIWVGAWWIGFIIAGISLNLLAIPLIMFPKIVPIKKIVGENTDNIKKSHISTLTDIMDIGKDILFNVKYICITLASTCTIFSLSGISTYGIKYIEIIYGLTTSSASLTAGLASIFPIIIGSLLGGFILAKFNWDLYGTLLFISVTTFLSCPFALGFLISCGDSKMAGVNTPYLGTDILTPQNLTSPCNSHCSCLQDDTLFRPSCGADSLIYFSICYAGCTTKNVVNNITTFNNCSCINRSDNGVQAINKTCHTILCFYFYMFLGALVILLLLTSVGATPVVIALMRSVKKHEMSVALAFKSMFNRLLGAIPGPILFGMAIDKSCILWGQKCKEIGRCLRYEFSFFKKVFVIWFIVSSLLISFFFILPRLILQSKCNKK